MRKLRLAAASLFLVPLVCSSASAEDNGKVYYKDGTRIETGEFDMKINILLQPRFTYEDRDVGGRRDAGIDDSGSDLNSFDVRRLELTFSGNLLNKRFSYKAQTDLRASTGSSDLRDAWLQWNSEDANVRWGQFKVPFSRQENSSSEYLMFIDRSAVSDTFAPSRQMGAMIHGPLAIASGGNYFIGAYNGSSTNEGINRKGVDTDLAVDAAMSVNFGDYGSRGMEGDFRKDTSTTAFTTGVAVIYSEGTGDPLATDAANDFDRFDLNVDAGMRSNGLDVQAEAYYSTISLDGVDGDAGEGDLFGFYVQAGYLVTPEWEPAIRFGYYQPDEDLTDIDDSEEFNLVVNYLINGNALKLQTGVSWIQTNLDDDASGEDFTDFRFQTQLSGYF